MLDECAVRAVRKIRRPKIHDGRLLITYSTKTIIVHINFTIHAALTLATRMNKQTNSNFLTIAITREMDGQTVHGTGAEFKCMIKI